MHRFLLAMASIPAQKTKMIWSQFESLQPRLIYKYTADIDHLSVSAFKIQGDLVLKDHF